MIRKRRKGYIDLTNTKQGKLTIINQIDKWNYNCECECGNKKIISYNHLTRLGRPTLSCGCLRGSKSKELNLRFKHGKLNTKEYRSWQSMIARCYYNKYDHYYLYGGRGITVCDRWKNSFLDFLEDVGEMPKDQRYTLDRIFSDGNYEPNNVKWSTNEEQANNRRNNIKVFYKGETKSIKAWCETLNLNYEKIRKKYRHKEEMSNEEFFEKYI